jgi:hypothetical protein
MTCQDARDLFSARADDALSPDEQAQLAAHLATCAECQREWARFERTVALLQAIEPAHAPAGFVDRLRLRFVFDFLDFYWNGYPHFATFNLADSAITVGVAMLLIDGPPLSEVTRGRVAALPAS